MRLEIQKEARQLAVFFVQCDGLTLRRPIPIELLNRFLGRCLRRFDRLRLKYRRFAAEP
ncbi:hypothetical protein [Vreelandella aquamarina]|uniref:hypothetical protein n=1 Tax=Vreelandella aquamarina TaxID=77097 RepID=UPI000A8C6C05|nr:hypothetical protein [Halomonas meridiana]